MKNLKTNPSTPSSTSSSPPSSTPSPALNEALTDAVRRWARPTTPAELQRRGISRVRSISLSRVASLIEKAVNRTMLARTIGDFPEDADSFSEAARVEFLRLMGSTPSTKDPKDGVERTASSALERLRIELAERRKQVEKEREKLSIVAGAVGEGDKILEEKLRKLFISWGGSKNRTSPLEREVIALSVGELRRERAHMERLRIDGHQSEIELLERRINKLSQLLDKTESDLAQAVRLAQVDSGVASIYDSVQGLSGEDANNLMKTELLSAIFEANLELRAAVTAAQ